MRRILAVAALGGALFAAAACGSDDNGDGGNGNGDSNGNNGGTASTEEVCAAGDELGAEFEPEFQQAGDALVEAAATGDEAAIEEAALAFTGVTGEMADRMRDIAADAEDPAVKAAVETYATELETLADQLAADPAALESLNTDGLDEATEAMDAYCA
jgi:hypothetical protein